MKQIFRNFTFLCRQAARTALCVTILAALCSCRESKTWHTMEGSVWNTTYRIQYESAVSLDDSISSLFHDVEMSLSPFNPQSLISRINRGETAETDSLIEKAFNVSLEINRLSHGRFDPTVSPLVNLWGFGYNAACRADAENDSGGFTVPKELIDSAMSLTGIAQCGISDGKIHKKHPATSFNFSAVTKGLACDLIGEMLRRNGADNYMVEIGGDIALGGESPRRQMWQIQIDAPVASSGTPVHTPMRIISISDAGIATSGNYRNFHDTKKYGRIGHTIDPVSGMPAQTDVVSATVIAPTAAMADAWATACMASMADSALAATAGATATKCLLVKTVGDTIAIAASPGFPGTDDRRAANR